MRTRVPSISYLYKPAFHPLGSKSKTHFTCSHAGRSRTSQGRAASSRNEIPASRPADAALARSNCVIKVLAPTHARGLPTFGMVCPASGRCRDI